VNLGTLFVQNVGYWAAFSAGLLSFFSPCVLPLIPAWLTLVTGLSFDELAAAEKKRFGFVKMLGPTLLFVLGFTLVFSLMGAAAGLVGELLNQYSHLVRYVAGALMIVFGLYLLGVISPAFLMKERRADLQRRPLGLAGSFLVGMGFAAGWTPCVGPILGGILAMAAYEQSADMGLRLLVVYSLGLGLPFLAVSALWGGALSFMSRVRPVVKWSGRVLGGLLIILGILVISGRLNAGLS